MIRPFIQELIPLDVRPWKVKVAWYLTPRADVVGWMFTCNTFEFKQLTPAAYLSAMQSARSC